MTLLPPLAEPVVAEPVAAAIAAGRPVVALESTIIAHGLPYPRNLETARELEAAVRESGAEPATIAVLDGRIRVGLGDTALDRLADPAADLAKVSRADLPVILARGGSGATTVAATMIGAHSAGIAVFATGGLGGVHRGAEHSFDISADLQELARTPVAVVCAGAKAILDLPKTLEVLETLGVPVIGYGTDDLPAFTVRSSGLPLTLRADTPGEVAGALVAQRALGYPGGAVIANPIRQDAALDPALVERAIGEGLAAAAAQGIHGKAVTPFLLSHMVTATGGASLDANVALVLDNARLAARIAAELARA